MASFRLRCHRDFILQVVEHDGWLLKHTDKKACEDKDIILAALSKCDYAYELISEQLSFDREILKKALKHDGRSLRYAHDSLKDCKEIAQLALESHPMAYEYLSERLKEDPALIQYALQQDPWIYTLIPKMLKTTWSYALIAMRNHLEMFEYMPYEIRKNYFFLQKSLMLSKTLKDFLSASVLEDLKLFFTMMQVSKSLYMSMKFQESLSEQHGSSGDLSDMFRATKSQNEFYIEFEDPSSICDHLDENFERNKEDAANNLLDSDNQLSLSEDDSNACEETKPLRACDSLRFSQKRLVNSTSDEWEIPAAPCENNPRKSSLSSYHGADLQKLLFTRKSLNEQQERQLCEQFIHSL